jgi:hypothetical protein
MTWQAKCFRHVSVASYVVASTCFLPRQSTHFVPSSHALLWRRMTWRAISAMPYTRKHLHRIMSVSKSKLNDTWRRLVYPIVYAKPRC